jgi:hypothetical protein
VHVSNTSSKAANNITNQVNKLYNTSSNITAPRYIIRNSMDGLKGSFTFIIPLGAADFTILVCISSIHMEKQLNPLLIALCDMAFIIMIYLLPLYYNNLVYIITI